MTLYEDLPLPGGLTLVDVYATFAGDALAEVQGAIVEAVLEEYPNAATDGVPNDDWPEALVFAVYEGSAPWTIDQLAGIFIQYDNG